MKKHLSLKKNRSAKQEPASSSKALSSPGNGTLIAHTTRSFVGPLPPPEVLAAYDKAQPGLAQVLVSSFQEESRHRRESEREMQNFLKEYQKKEYTLTSRGQWFGISFGILIVIAATYLAMMDKTSVALALGGLDIIGISSVFIFSYRKKSEETERG